MSSGKVGPRVVVLAAVHGDERVGVKIIQRLQKDILPVDINGSLTFVMGNPAAYEKNVRFVECDLNRLFGVRKFCGQVEHSEHDRADELKKILAEADYMLDIHATIRPSVPFVFCSQSLQHQDIVSVFDIEYVVSPAATFMPDELMSSTDNFVDKSGGVGITYEAGWLADSTTEERAYRNVLKFLHKVGVLNSAHSEIRTTSAEHLEIYASLHASTDQFTFAREFKNFDIVAPGESIAQDGLRMRSIPVSSYIVFPKTRFIPGSPMCYFARPITTT